jgi:hypothetical protein
MTTKNGSRAARRVPRPQLRRRTLLGGVIGAAILGVTPAVALAATGTSSVTAQAGSLSIGSTTPETISVPVAANGSGILPAAVWSDTTGSGTGWNGTVAVSDLTYTGAWAQVGGTTTALGSATFTYTGTADGLEYTVTVGSGGTGTSTPYTWKSNTTLATNVSGSGTATNGTAVTIGTLGVKINFANGTTYPSGASYRLKVGTQKSTAFSLDSLATGAGVTAQSGTTSTPPKLATGTTTVSGGGVGTLGSAVKFLSAAIGNGMGSYTVKPGVKVQTDAGTWAQTYTAKVQYSIVTGP